MEVLLMRRNSLDSALSKVA